MKLEDLTNKKLLCYAHYLQRGLRLFPQYILDDAGQMLPIDKTEAKAAFPPYGAIYIVDKFEKHDRYSCGKPILIALIPRKSSLRYETSSQNENDSREFDNYTAKCDDINIQPYLYTHSYPSVISYDSSQELMDRAAISFDNSNKVLNESPDGIFLVCNDKIVGPCSYSFDQDSIILNGGLEKKHYQVKLYNRNKLDTYSVLDRSENPIMSFISKADIERAECIEERDYLTRDQMISILIKCLENVPSANGIEFTRKIKHELKNILASHSILSVNKEQRIEFFDKFLSKAEDISDDIQDSVCNCIRKNNILADKVITNLINQRDPNEFIKKIFKEFPFLEQVYITEEQSRELREEINSLRSELQAHTESAEKSEAYGKELDEARKQIERLQNDIDAQKQKYADLESASGDLKKISNDIQAKEAELNQKNQALKKVTKNIVQALEKELKDAKDALAVKIDNFKGSAKEVEEKFADIYGKQFGQMLNPLVNDLIKQVEYELTNNKENKNRDQLSAVEEDKPDSNINASQSIPLVPIDPDLSSKDTGDQIIKLVKTYLKHNGRDIDDHDIANYLVCLTQGFITTFAGKPGSGKTSLCNLIAEALGLKTNSKNTHFIDVSVGRGWASHKDFIGYYNPITEKIVKTNEEVYNALDISEKEDSGQSPPMVIMLDEANLSPLEHYWAPFLKHADTDNRSNRAINIGSSHTLKISNHLRFFATINHDHTTEELSPRFLDRSWVIMLDESIEELPQKQEIVSIPTEAISYSSLQKAFGVKNDDKPSDLLIEKWGKVREELINKLHLDVMGRSFNMIINYVCVAQKYMADESMALDYAISQKVLPQLSLYGAEYKQKLKDTAALCNNLSLMRCYKLLSKIADSSNMDVYQFFAR